VERAKEVHSGDEKFDATFFSAATAVENLTYEEDRELVRKAVELVSATYTIFEKAQQ
jgi:hypothetical protein